MIKIEPISVGLPAVMANALVVRTMPIDTSDVTCGLYYELYREEIVVSEDLEPYTTSTLLAKGNLELNEEEFRLWGNTMSYIEDIAISKLGLSLDN